MTSAKPSPAPTGLDEILVAGRKTLADHQSQKKLAQLEREISQRPLPLSLAAAVDQSQRVSLIAELKKASPSAGLLRSRYDVKAGAQAYARAGARALSVLTEESFFQGSLEHLSQAKAAVRLPILRKDFLIDPYQIFEACAYGADAVLLIVAILEKNLLKEMLKVAARLNLSALVETHTEEEVEVALSVDARVVGVNSRNLKDLSMNPDAFEKLLPKIPRNKIRVAESGLRTASDVQRLRSLGVQAMLVGESFLRQTDLEAAARTLVEAGQS